MNGTVRFNANLQELLESLYPSCSFGMKALRNETLRHSQVYLAGMHHSLRNVQPLIEGVGRVEQETVNIATIQMMVSHVFPSAESVIPCERGGKQSLLLQLELIQLIHPCRIPRKNRIE